MKNKVILFDIDHTLFDTNTLRHIISQELQKQLPTLSLNEIQTADAAAHTKMNMLQKFSPLQFAQLFSEEVKGKVSAEDVVHIWTNKEIFTQCVYPDAAPVLQHLEDKGYILGIFSTGVTDFQLAKIAALEAFLDREHVHIFELKDERLPEIIHKYEDKEIILIDDTLHILQQANMIDPLLKTIWIKRDKLTAKQHIEGFNPYAVIDNLNELLSVI